MGALCAPGTNFPPGEGPHNTLSQWAQASGFALLGPLGPALVHSYSPFPPSWSPGGQRPVGGTQGRRPTPTTPGSELRGCNL
eukprot:scaffold167116_cov30-Tisochrysis_lutea.AAC.1